MRDIIIGAEQQLQAGRLAAMEFALQPQAIQQATLPTLQAPPPLSAEAQRLLNIGSVQQAVAARSIQQWNDRIALSDAQEVFKNMNAGYAQALYAAERWAVMNMPPADTSLGGGTRSLGGYGGFGGGGDPRGYAFSLGLYNWRIG